MLPPFYHFLALAALCTILVGATQTDSPPAPPRRMTPGFRSFKTGNGQRRFMRFASSGNRKTGSNSIRKPIEDADGPEIHETGSRRYSGMFGKLFKSKGKEQEQEREKEQEQQPEQAANTPYDFQGHHQTSKQSQHSAEDVYNTQDRENMEWMRKKLAEGKAHDDKKKDDEHSKWIEDLFGESHLSAEDAPLPPAPWQIFVPMEFNQDGVSPREFAGSPRGWSRSLHQKSPRKVLERDLGQDMASKTRRLF